MIEEVGWEALVEERLKILRAMEEVAGKVGLKEFSAMVGMSLGRTLGYLQGLVKTGFVKKTERRYSITSEGKIAIKALKPVPKGKEFHFYAGVGQPTGLSAKSLEDFCEALKKVDVRTLEFHVPRGDFENWVTAVFNDTKLANDMARVKELNLAGERLRKEVLGLTEARYNKFKKLIAT